MSTKIKRKLMAHFVDAALPDAVSPEYVRLGVDLEEYNVEMNPNLTTKNNIIGETSVILDSYQPQASVEPFYAEEGDPLFDRLQGIIDDRQTLDDLKTTTLEVHLWDENTEAAGTFAAYREDAIFEVTNYGGDTTGYQIPFNVHHTGNRVKGTFNLQNRTFTPDSE